MTDPHLQHLADAAERGERCPHLRLFTSSWLILGLPVSHARLLELMQTAMRAGVHDQLEAAAEGKRGHADEREVDRTTLSLMTTVGPVDDARGFLNLTNVRAFASNGMQGAVIKTPALRVPIEHIDAWTAVRCDMSMPAQGQGGGAGFGVGVGVVVPLEF